MYASWGKFNIALALTLVLLAVVAVFFSQGIWPPPPDPEVTRFYNRYHDALGNFLATDLNRCLPLKDGQQRFEMGEDNPGADDSGALDWISFRATACTTEGFKRAQVKYYLVKETDPAILHRPDVGKTATPNRPLYVLRRQTADFDGANKEDSDLCHYVLSFNIEVFDTAETKLKQLKDVQFDYPIGDNKPEDENIPRLIRVSLRVMASNWRAERLIQRDIAIPAATWVD